MGLATHLGPWLLGTVRSTTGTTAGTVRNLGAAVVVQSGPVLYTNTSGAVAQIAVLPAGAQIVNCFLDVNTAFNQATTNVVTIKSAAGTSLVTFSGGTTIGTGRNGGLDVNTAVVWAVGSTQNIGTSDVIVNAVVSGTGTAATTGAATVIIEYVVRLSDGSYLPTATTGP